MNPFSAYSKVVNNIRLLLSNPTSAFVAVVIIFQIIVATGFSVIFPILLRWFILPTSIQHRIPLNVVFSTCRDELHGACSFPYAKVDFAPRSIFSPSVEYALSVDLKFADVQLNKNLGVFQNTIYLNDEHGSRIVEYKKASYIRTPSFIVKMMWICFFPLYLVGWFHDYSNLEIPITLGHLENVVPSSQLVYELQDKFAQLESADLLINAKFGIVRHVLYYWPLMSYLALALTCFAGCFAIIFIYWGRRSLSFLNQPESVEVDEKEEKGNVVSQSEELAKPKKEKKLKQRTRRASDEFIPDNKEELPECVNLSGIPGWDTVPDAVTDSIIQSPETNESLSSVRHRKKTEDS